jgi:hypothetical protein
LTCKRFGELGQADEMLEGIALRVGCLDAGQVRLASLAQ